MIFHRMERKAEREERTQSNYILSVDFNLTLLEKGFKCLVILIITDL